MSVLEPRLDPETVSALLDTGWRAAEAEAGRTDSLDRKTATLASFASLLVSIAAVSAASVGRTDLPEAGRLMVVAGLICAITLLTGAVIVAVVVALLPQEHTGLSPVFIEGLPTWREVRKPPAVVNGEVLHGVVDMVGQERSVNDRKTRLVRASPSPVGRRPHRARRAYTDRVDDDTMNKAEPEPTEIDLDASPFEPVPVSSLPLDKEERRELKRILAKYAAARAKVGPRELAYTEDSPFGIPPLD